MIYKLSLLLLCLAGASIVKFFLDSFSIIKEFRIDWVTTITCGIVAYIIISKPFEK